MKNLIMKCKKHYFLTIIVLAVVLAIITAIILFTVDFPTNKNIGIKYSDKLNELMHRKKVNGKLKSVEYHCSGDMEGNVYSLKLDINEEKLIVSTANMHSDPVTVSEYSVNKKDIEAIKKDVNLYNLPVWEKEKMDETLFAYDACSPGIQLTYTDSNDKFYDIYNISLNLKLPNDAHKVLNDLKDHLTELASDDNLIQTYVNTNY